jgi:site-specific DNA-methyltransferase (adenine-specific)
VLNQIVNTDVVEGLMSLPDKSIDLTVTSPPYDNLRSYEGNLTWDFEATARELYRVTKPGGVVVWIVGDQTINGSETGTSFKQALFFKEIGFNLHDTMIWTKMSPFQHKNRYIPNFEYMFVFSKGKPKTANLIMDRKNKYAGTRVHGTERQVDGGLRQKSDKQKAKTIKEFGARCNVWDMPCAKGKQKHPAVFPFRLARDHIYTWSNEGDTVLDPFVGSGTTAVAAKILGRNYIGFDISKKYCDIAIEKLEEIL